MRNWMGEAFLSLLVATFVGGCADSSDKPALGADVFAEADMMSSDATTAPDEADVPRGPADASVDEVRWPVGPYGMEYLDVIANEGFYDPWTGETIRLSDYYGDPLVNGILIVSAAGWCSACSYEAWDLVDVHDQYADYGLVVLYTLYEDAAGRPLWVEGAPQADWERDFIFMSQYRESLGALARLPPREANFPVLIDRGHTLGAYFNRNATPLTLIVRASDMRIIYREVGYSAGMIQNMVKAALF